MHTMNDELCISCEFEADIYEGFEETTDGHSPVKYAEIEDVKLTEAIVNDDKLSRKELAARFGNEFVDRLEREAINREMDVWE